MPLRFYRRVRLWPGLRVNFSKSGASLSVGTRGAWYTFGPRGQRVSLGLPGTGLYWVEHIPPGAHVQHRHQLAFALLCAAGLVLATWALVAALGSVR